MEEHVLAFLEDAIVTFLEISFSYHGAAFLTF